MGGGGANEHFRETNLYRTMKTHLAVRKAEEKGHHHTLKRDKNRCLPSIEAGSI